jgi:REP element-mobilizing transposase RayT
LEKAKQVQTIITEICRDKGIYLEQLFVNAEHVHLLIALPVNLTIQDSMQTLKGLSSHIINEKGLFGTKFHWARGYAAFSVSSSNLDRVASYIRNQREHHSKHAFDKEWNLFQQEFDKKNHK